MKMIKITRNSAINTLTTCYIVTQPSTVWTRTASIMEWYQDASGCVLSPVGPARVGVSAQLLTVCGRSRGRRHHQSAARQELLGCQWRRHGALSNSLWGALFGLGARADHLITPGRHGPLAASGSSSYSEPLTAEDRLTGWVHSVCLPMPVATLPPVRRFSSPPVHSERRRRSGAGWLGRRRSVAPRRWTRLCRPAAV